ncbi:MAG: hypothetical protein ACT4PT_11315 [Methanobacteriota archaeon]
MTRIPLWAGWLAIGVANAVFSFLNVSGGDPWYGLLLAVGAAGFVGVAVALRDDRGGLLAFSGAALAAAGALRVLVNVVRQDWSPYFVPLLLVAGASFVVASAARHGAGRGRAGLELGARAFAVAYVTYLVLNLVGGGSSPVVDASFALAALGAAFYGWGARGAQISTSAPSGSRT